MLVHTHPVLVKFPALHAYRQHVPEFLVIRYTLSTHTTMHFCLYTNCFHLLSLPTPLKVVLWQAGCACMRIKENRGVCSACIMRALHREGRRWCAIFTLDCHLAYILLYLPSPTIPFFFLKSMVAIAVMLVLIVNCVPHPLDILLFTPITPTHPARSNVQYIILQLQHEPRARVSSRHQAFFPCRPEPR